MDKLQNIHSIKFINDQMIIEIDDHKYIIDLNQVSNRLLNATEEQRNNFEISPANYGIHWPLIDEDLAINNLIKSSSVFSA
jgi:hypothetical protein